MNEQERTALRRRIDHILSLHDWINPGDSYCTCGRWVSDMDAHRAGAVEKVVSDMLDIRNIRIARLTESNNRLHAAWRNARERARMAKSAWRSAEHNAGKQREEVTKQYDFAHKLWEELRRRSKEKGSAVRQAQKWKQAYKRNEHAVQGLTELVRAIQRIANLHFPHEDNFADLGLTYCSECSDDYPCATITMTQKIRQYAEFLTKKEDTQ